MSAVAACGQSLSPHHYHAKAHFFGGRLGCMEWAYSFNVPAP